MYYLRGDHGVTINNRVEVLSLLSIECSHCGHMRFYNANKVGPWITKNPEGAGET